MSRSPARLWGPSSARLSAGSSHHRDPDVALNIALTWPYMKPGVYYLQTPYTPHITTLSIHDYTHQTLMRPWLMCSNSSCRRTPRSTLRGAAQNFYISGPSRLRGAQKPTRQIKVKTPAGVVSDDLRPRNLQLAASLLQSGSKAQDKGDQKKNRWLSRTHCKAVEPMGCSGSLCL